MQKQLRSAPKKVAAGKRENHLRGLWARMKCQIHLQKVQKDDLMPPLSAEPKGKEGVKRPPAESARMAIGKFACHDHPEGF